MCRLLGVVARRPAPVGDLLSDELGRLPTLAAEHGDGWGIAYRDAGGRIGMVKDVDRGNGSSPSMRAGLEDVVTDMALLHLRMASPGSAVTAANTHPFGDAGMAFAHNGEFRPRTCVDDLLGPAALARAAGETDSERYFLAVRRRLDQGSPLAEAVPRAAADVTARAGTCISLNCLVLTPRALLAYAQHDPSSAVVAARGPDYFRLSYRQDADRTVVASQGWAAAELPWRPLPERHLLTVSRGAGSARVRGG